eukprot:GEZU01003183.1.p1 GENE.GEZU01003183.1~~GEZU01003183.1.p1  ORF type:complete len:436 (+),score=125.18 GEZU01003183.1:74-1381(+)
MGDVDEGNYYDPTSGGSSAPGRPVDLGEVSPLVLMDDIVEKLKLLNYEHGFCAKYGLRPLERTYFALPLSNASEQLYYFATLVSWILSLTKQNFLPPAKFEDPNVTASNIMVEVKKFGLETNFPVQKLKQAYGEIVCNVLNNLLDRTLERIQFKFLAPEYPPSMGMAGDGYTEEDEIIDDEGVDELREDAHEEEDDEEEYYFMPISDQRKGGKATGGDADGLGPDNKLIESEIDPEKWKLELERVGPQLTKLKLQVDTKDWRTHVEQMQTLQQTVQQLFPEVESQLNKISDEISKISDKIKRRETMISTQFEHLIEEYRKGTQELNEINDTYKVSRDNIDNYQNQLNKLSEELDEIKVTMEKNSKKMQDTSPLQNIKDTIAKMKNEIRNMDLRIGVLQHTVLQASLKSRANSNAAAKDKDSNDDSFTNYSSMPVF